MARFVDTFARVLGDPGAPAPVLHRGRRRWPSRTRSRSPSTGRCRWNEAHGIDAGARHPGACTSARPSTAAAATRCRSPTPIPNKIARFPKFDWPRIDQPVLIARRRATSGACTRPSARRCAGARRPSRRNPHDIACFIVEPIQGEGGDHHFRPEFLRSAAGSCATSYDALFVVDEVQTGCGLTGNAVGLPAARASSPTSSRSARRRRSAA